MNENNDLKIDGNENKDDTVKKESIFKKIGASFKSRRFRSGAYVSLISAIVIIMVLVVNLIISKFDLKVDLSSQNLYTLTDDTKNVVKNLKDDVTIYYLVQTGSEVTIFQKIAQKYDSMSNHIKLVEKDPVQYPQFAKQYVDDDVASNSFLVVNDKTKTAKYVAYDDLLVQELDYSTYSNKTTGIDVEGKLTSAIQYVTSNKLPKLYQTSGHSEAEVGDLFKSTLDKQNVSVDSLKTLTQAIPEDCDILLINAPKSDFTEDEIKKIKDYMAAGGNVVATVNYEAKDLKNLNSLLEYYGIQIQDGIVCEGDSNMHLDYPHYIIPSVESHDITSKAAGSNKNIVTPISSGLSIMDNLRSSLKVTPLLKTSDKSYSKVNVNANTFDKEDGDLDGPFNVGLLATDTYNNVTSNLVVYSSEYMFDDSSLQSFANTEILTGTVGFLSGDTSSVSVPTRSIETQTISISSQKIAIWGSLVVIILPVAILAAGIVVSLRRRKR